MDTGRLQALDISNQISKQANFDPHLVLRTKDSQVRRQVGLQM
jgi:hypothetical protein